jgi:hypothetical protein
MFVPHRPTTLIGINPVFKDGVFLVIKATLNFASWAIRHSRAIHLITYP